MSVYKPKASPFWHYDFVFQGVRHHGSTGEKTEAKARAVEEALKTEARRAHFFGGPKKRPAMAVKAAMGRYFEEVSDHTASADDELSRMEVLAEVLGKDTPLAHIDDNTLSDLVGRLRGRRRRIKGKGGQDALIANGTVNRYVECLRRVWRRAAKVWKVEVGDEPDWGAHLLPEPQERVRELSAEEEAALFQHLRADLAPLVRFALMSGMRLANLRRLTWKDVDYNTRTVTIRLKSSTPGGRVHTVPLTTAMVALLAEQKGNHPIYVFTYQCAKTRGAKRLKGGHYPISRDGWRKAWEAALKAAGIEDFRFHDTRHTAATRTLRASGNLKATSRMLGHTDITTTARYAHALTDDIRQAMEAAQSRNNPEQGGSSAHDEMAERKA